MSPRPSSRDTILDAAEAVTMECGAVHMTLDAVAEKAGVSKGGLMYHFPSKEALLEAMVSRFLDRFNDVRMQVLSETEPGPMREARAYVRAALLNLTESERVRSSFLAAAANGTEAMRPVKEYYQQRFAAFDGAEDEFIWSAIAVLAADGLWILELLGLSPITVPQRQHIAEKLIELLSEGHAQPAVPPANQETPVSH